MAKEQRCFDKMGNLSSERANGDPDIDLRLVSCKRGKKCSYLLSFRDIFEI